MRSGPLTRVGMGFFSP